MFQKLSIFARLIILTAIMILALFMNAIIGWLGFHSASQNLESVYQGSVEEILQLSKLNNLYEIDIAGTLHKARQGIVIWGEAEKKIKEAIEEESVIFSRYLQHIKEDFKEEVLPIDVKNQIDVLQRQIQEARLVFEKLENIFKRHNQEELNRFALEGLYAVLDPIALTLEELIDWHISDTRMDYNQAEQEIAFYNQWMLILFFIALLVSLLVALLITFSITRPLKKVVEDINKVAMGDLTSYFDYNQCSETEIGHLFTSVNKMIESNKKIVEAISKFSIGEIPLQVEPRSEKDILSKALNEMIISAKKMSEAITALTNGDLQVSVSPRSDQDVLGLALESLTKKLRQIIGSIQTEVISLTKSSQEIVNSVSQVAISSSETAAAVTETTTTVEELKQTAQVSADKASDVLASAEGTLQIVKDSEKSLRSTIEDMNQINERMHSISEGIVKLSELSQTIGEIIDTVNDLAEQSNLLAVNAAIEAAKAGEHGKGFSVVAQEIRTLAEQSKAATIQVRAILNDIQNATSTAVLATEQGAKAVEKGVQQSSQTNESMRVLLTSIGNVAQAANQITISSQQQLVGVDQVNIAMNNINEATKQHIENMKTIENSVVAFNLTGQTLKKITEQFILAHSK